ncbi:MAG: NAD(P)H-dependent oxidoreductase [Armatimonadetes bacterium]|nr:NAD(P)H-dependent oxidoreductase [Armatimonadota bacterium]
MSNLLVAVDGASKGNPGAAGIGVVVYGESGKVVREISEHIGIATNNVAEYAALIRGLEEALKLGAESVRVQTDSELLARQIAGTYKVRAAHLSSYHERAKSLLAQFRKAEISHVPRGQNAHADRLASKAANGETHAKNKKNKKPNAGGGQKMKVVAFNGSARRDGNTAILINRVFNELEKEGIATEMYQFPGRTIRGCRACFRCIENKDGHCAFWDDVANECINKMAEADGIILASPTYFADISTELKALIDRAGMVSLANGYMLKRKVGAAVIAVRRGGAIHAFDSINHFFFINQMIVPGSSYWNMGIGREIGKVENDEEGLRTMSNLGQNMAWLLKRLKE